MSKKKDPLFILAPMDDVTDTVFRQIVSECSAPDVYFTEFVNVDGLQSPGRNNLLRKLQYMSKEKPLIAQIWGKNPDNFRKTAAELVEMGFAGVDLNMGCPVKAVVKDGCCSALMNNREPALEIINATKEGVDNKIPVSIKTRIGFNSIDYSWHEFLLDQDLHMLTIHGRTKLEQSLVPANWGAIDHIRQIRDRVAPNTLIVGNGDIVSREQGEEFAKEYSLDGIMIGRGALKNPYIFAKHSKWDTFSKQQKIDLFIKHIQLFVQTWGNNDRRLVTLNKFCKIYINGFDGAKELREKLMEQSKAQGLLDLLQAER